MELILHPAFYTPLIGIIGAIFGSWLTYIFALKRYHREKQYENKLKRYLILVEKMRSFVKDISDFEAGSEDRKKFVDSYRTIWLYGSSSVVKEVSKFLKIVLNPPPSNGEKMIAEKEAKKIIKKAIIEMRKDLKAKGKLKSNDFEIFI